MPKLTPNMFAYNECVEAKNEALSRLMPALDDYNRAAKACETLFPLNQFKRLVLEVRDIA